MAPQTAHDDDGEGPRPLSTDDMRAPSAAERAKIFTELALLVEEGAFSLGDAVRVLRMRLLGFDRVRFAKATGVSVMALTRLEDGRDANPTLETLTKVLRPFGGKVTLAFPKVAVREPPDDERAKLRARLVASLAKTKRKRRANASSASSTEAAAEARLRTRA